MFVTDTGALDAVAVSFSMGATVCEDETVAADGADVLALTLIEANGVTLMHEPYPG